MASAPADAPKTTDQLEDSIPQPEELPRPGCDVVAVRLKRGRRNITIGAGHDRGGLQSEAAGPVEDQIIAGPGRGKIGRHRQREADVVEIAEGSAVTKIDFNDIETQRGGVELGERWDHQVINIEIEGGQIVRSRPGDDAGVMPADTDRKSTRLNSSH